MLVGISDVQAFQLFIPGLIAVFCTLIVFQDGLKKQFDIVLTNNNYEPVHQQGALDSWVDESINRFSVNGVLRENKNNDER